MAWTSGLGDCGCLGGPCGACEEVYSVAYTAAYYNNTTCTGSPFFSGTATENAAANEACTVYTMEFSLVTLTWNGSVWLVGDFYLGTSVGEIAADGNGCPLGAFTSYGCVNNGVDSGNVTAVVVT